MREMQNVKLTEGRAGHGQDQSQWCPCVCARVWLPCDVSRYEIKSRQKHYPQILISPAGHNPFGAFILGPSRQSQVAITRHGKIRKQQ